MKRMVKETQTGSEINSESTVCRVSRAMQRCLKSSVVVPANKNASDVNSNDCCWVAGSESESGAVGKYRGDFCSHLVHYVKHSPVCGNLCSDDIRCTRLGCDFCILCRVA